METGTLVLASKVINNPPQRIILEGEIQLYHMSSARDLSISLVPHCQHGIYVPDEIP